MSNTIRVTRGAVWRRCWRGFAARTPPKRRAPAMDSTKPPWTRAASSPRPGAPVVMYAERRQAPQILCGTEQRKVVRHASAATYPGTSATVASLSRGASSRCSARGTSPSTDASLRTADTPTGGSRALELLLEVLVARDGAAALEALAVHREAPDSELLHHARDPLAELHRALGVDLVADRDDGREVIVLGDVALTVGGSYSKTSRTAPSSSSLSSKTFFRW